MKKYIQIINVLQKSQTYTLGIIYLFIFDTHWDNSRSQCQRLYYKEETLTIGYKFLYKNIVVTIAIRNQVLT